MRRLFTSESVTEGHPDKICDQISDAILDAILNQDPQARVACETAVTTGMVLVMGEITTNCYVDIKAIVRQTIREIGYDDPDFGFDYKSCAVLVALDEQSPDIAMGVDQALETRSKEDIKDIGAGDQGMMIGYACKETEEMMPLPIALSHRLAKRLSEVRKDGTLEYLRPDGKTQVTVEYEDGKASRIDTIVISTQHDDGIEHDMIDKDLIFTVIKPVIPNELIDLNTKILINPTGRFVIGGPVGDAGLTGRKIIVDTYGGYASHGGGAFSGKDPTKVDRSGAYMARYIAKNVVAAGLAEKLEIEVSYAIGVKTPISIYVNTFGTGKLEDDLIVSLIKSVFDLSPGGIIRTLDLRRPIYRQTAAYGHFGRSDVSLPWEQIDKVEELIRQADLYRKI
ncbi:methionine adenosyltransferase [Acidaminobacter sp. JC074]|uniref:methionine adenosyltransferase n=1 Tax=Acidaminobacter sp. JC074 TaxID=2530199 RepID=UPI001F0F4E02|nr:methionine adenosyltransferase [Acidaminobacter sp. JC074]MCH4887090.1 methionine adenosyltransferase [Acidaminobacter sp. JC074]